MTGIFITDRKGNKCIDKAITFEDVFLPLKIIITKVKKKPLKYKDLEIKINRMWSVKTDIMPIALEALELIEKEMETFIKYISGRIESNAVQNFGKARILQRRNDNHVTSFIPRIRMFVWTPHFRIQMPRREKEEKRKENEDKQLEDNVSHEKDGLDRNK